jgi:SAM-dependent methyltransferase
MGKFLDIVDLLSGRILPQKFGKHYLRPRMERRRQVPYDGKEYFESVYKASLANEFSDGITLRGRYDPLHARYHYNLMENLIIEYFAEAGFKQGPRTLDLGSGAGHWIDFLLEVFRARRAVGVEISPSAVAALRRKYEGDERVTIVEGDASEDRFGLGESFDLISAIGVMFHIVDDARWERAVANLAGHLEPDGVMVVGGQFGRVTDNVQFHDTDQFDNWDEARTARGEVALVDKRIRSLRLWKNCADRAGLRVLAVKRADPQKGIETPENNVMVLGRKTS